MGPRGESASRQRCARRVRPTQPGELDVYTHPCVLSERLVASKETPAPNRDSFGLRHTRVDQRQEGTVPHKYLSIVLMTTCVHIQPRALPLVFESRSCGALPICFGLSRGLARCVFHSAVPPLGACHSRCGNNCPEGRS